MIGYKSFIEEKTENYLKMSALLNYTVDLSSDEEDIFKIFCVGCRSELGLKLTKEAKRDNNNKRMNNNTTTSLLI